MENPHANDSFIFNFKGKEFLSKWTLNINSDSAENTNQYKTFNESYYLQNMHL